MRIGYACLTIGVRDSNFRRCMLKNASEDKLLSIIKHNLNSLENIIDYNIENNIKLFRISSDLIPFGSSQVNRIPWWDVYASRFSLIGRKIREAGIRVSMHPGQYTVLNSPKVDVVKGAIDDLIYHNRVLDSLGVNIDGKIVLHIGGVYRNKEEAINRFVTNFKLLDIRIKERLVVENDDKSFNIADALKVGNSLNIPVVFDNLHNEVLPFDITKDNKYWIEQCKKTWKKEDGTQKIHYSQQNLDKKPGAHSNTIDLESFMSFVEDLNSETDIMLEVKDKNISAIKCINGINANNKIKTLEVEWSKYKYNVLEHSSEKYNKIRKLLKEKDCYPVVEFYKLIDDALSIEITKGNFINAALHVWGYFKSKASDAEKSKFMKSLERYKQDKLSEKTVKNQLMKMALKYEEEYLLNSYYFYL